ncbi:enoyl-CoA delta isomerase 2, peroxisomal-like [Phalaenopsis equestris]|uniref:enoyl-CoA delta isomerase 2, peroxisomal-like n=1 Tax=Phalaenopsis equestris TaxID=78828 RepID=UPI0009E38301|nr:enoyl-CoA delta isomerase 2, peroxisomal-like [Phalaenopsis equestris]
MCTIEKRGRVFVLTLTGEGEHRLSPDVIDAIRSALAYAKTDYYSCGRRGRALVVTAQGRFFSNGFDIAWSKAASSPAAFQARVISMGSLFIKLIADLLALPMPTIAAVNGHSSAAGFILAISHDYVEMRADRGFIYMSEIDLGMPLPPYFLTLIRSKVSDAKVVRDLVLRGAKLKAAEAQAKGIIDGSHIGAAETVEAAVRRVDELLERDWNGDVYASIRRSSLPEICKAVGLSEETEEERQKLLFAVAKL